MDLASLIQLADSGNVRDVEDAWLQALEDEAPAEVWVERATLLEALARNGHADEAETLASTTLEMVAETLGAPAAVPVAAAFLLACGAGDKLRRQVAGVYLNACTDVPGLDVLINEAGLEGGRPARRALRTLDVALRLAEGSYLAHRHEESAARVEEIDAATWKVRVTTRTGQLNLSAVELADAYEPADTQSFVVLRDFDPERLRDLLVDDPAGALVDFLRAHPQGVDSDTLQGMLSPRFIPAGEWAKWWTRARQVLRLSPHIVIEGRGPCFLRYNAAGISFADEIAAKLKQARDPLKELAVLEEYVRGCRTRKQEPDLELLGRICTQIEERARKHAVRTGRAALSPWLAARRIRQLRGEADPDQHVRKVLAAADDPVNLILEIAEPDLWAQACTVLAVLDEDGLGPALERLLPRAPVEVANQLARRLVELGTPPQRFAELADAILKDPLEFNEGLLWLWNGPEPQDARVAVPLVKILTRILQALGELRHHPDLSAARRKQILARNREVLRARKYERFRQLLEEIEPGLATALYTQIRRVHELGLAAGEDMQKLLRRKFPLLTRKTDVPKWQQEDVMYVTAAGLRRKQAELDELVNVKMRENAIAIGRAAEHGDLSENSEYKFALEERDLLRARLAQVNKEMSIAQVMGSGEVPRDYVGIGARILLEHVADRTRLHITILSSWEADPAQGVYNYKTPLAQGLLGARLEQTVELPFATPPGAYRIVQLASALEDPKYSADAPLPARPGAGPA